MNELVIQDNNPIANIKRSTDVAGLLSKLKENYTIRI